MDPLAHTLTGANLAATRLGGKTRFAAAALVVGANAPDIDAVLYLIDNRDLALGFRRGWTHGVLAMVVLPLVLTAVLVFLDRLRPHPERRTDPKWLLLLSSIAVWTHPVLDWLNSYGMRWLMPFRPDWFYGDAVNIADPWIWLVLGAGWFLGRRPTVTLTAVWAFFSFLVIRMVAGRASEYLTLVSLIAAILLVALLIRKPARDAELVHRIAATALLITTLYIGSRIAIVLATKDAVRKRLTSPEISQIEEVMLSPDPIDPTTWSFVVATPEQYRWGRTSWFGRNLQLDPGSLPVASPSPEWEIAQRDPSIQGFLTWIRFPSYEISREGGETRVLIYDARRATRDRLRPRIVEIPE